MLYRVYCHGSCSYHILALNILELKDSLIFTVECWLIKLSDTKILLSTIWLGHLETSIDFSNSRYVIGNERLQLSIKIQFLRLVSLNILKQVLNVLRHRQVGVLSRVIGAWHLLVILSIFFVFRPWLLGERHSRLLLGALRNCLSLILLLILGASANIVHVHLIILFV